MSETIGLIGLGRMGMEAAKKYIAQGYKVVGYARRPEVIKEFTAAGGISVGNSREVAQKSGKVIVYDDAPVHPMKTRWGILVEPPAPGKPLTSRVVHLSENAFLALPPPPASQPQ